MGNTEFYREAGKRDSKISWKDIFSQSFVKHTRADREYAMQVGTLARQVSEADMLKTWHKPWLWLPSLLFGLALVAVMIIALYVPHQVTTISLMVAFISPLVLPFVIMIFMWEMNVAQNISLGDLLLYYIASALISFVVTSMLFSVVPGGYNPFAAFREEPAKLAAVILILWFMQKYQHKKIYAVTALAVGAAVGSSFSGIESVSYAMSGDMLQSIWLRSLFVLSGHIMYALPYATAIGLHCKNGKMDSNSVFNWQTIGAFLFSIFLHYTWNGGFGLMAVLGFPLRILFQVLSVFIYLYWIRLALRQIVSICGPISRNPGFSRPVIHPGGVQVRELVLTCEAGPLMGRSWRNTGSVILIGRQEGCGICFGSNAKGVSRVHCRVLLSGGIWVIQDLNSTYGTYVGNTRLSPNELRPLQPGDRISLGSKQVVLRVQ